jgi:hypothetical protein
MIKTKFQSSYFVFHMDDFFYGEEFYLLENSFFLNDFR